MQIAFRRGNQVAARVSARHVAGRRHRLRHLRTFHASSASSLSLFPWGSNDPNEQDAPQLNRDQQPAVAPQQQVRQEAPEAKPIPDPTPSNGNNARERDYGSASRRWMRNRRPKDLPPITIPAWFYERNVKLKEHATSLLDGRLALVPRPSPKQAEQTDDKVDDGEKSKDDIVATDEVTKDDGNNAEKVYKISEAIMAELVASMAAGLSFSKIEGSQQSFASGKSHLKLHCPIDGALYFVEKAVEEAASRLQADVIRIDAQDLAEIAGDYIKEGPEATSNSLWSLGYDAQQIFPRNPAPESADDGEAANEDDASMEEDEKETRQTKQFQVAAIPISGLNLADLFKKAGPGGSSAKRSNGPNILDFLSGGGSSGGDTMELSGPLQQSSNSATQWNDLKLNALLESLLESNQIKRFDPIPSDAEPASVDHDAPVEVPARANASLANARTILMIRGYKELAVPQQGRLLLEKIQNIVSKKRKEGQPIVIVGTTASADLTPEISREAFETLQTDGPQTPFRTMVITPEEAGPAGGLFYNDIGRRIREVNVRHLFALLVRLSSSAGRPVPRSLTEFDKQLNFGPHNARLSAVLDDQVFMFDLVHRIILTALGHQAALEGGTEPREALKPESIVEAMKLLDTSDNAKSDWAKSEQQLEEGPEEPEQPKKSPVDAKLKAIRKQCNSHEKVLMRGVVNPENIRTTFDEVHAPKETIEALKTLTTLSLTRPEAFKYGVLATDKITGLLLYGPPGTGKTLLAKAVAKESGATVLEVSGSDVYDMYVGESEKNVRAIFSLAKKLSPCVVFIDEADAIFASRGSGTSRNTHRELINQFLREWDGMTDTNAFIMVATNRPFDLDDAALRRLPRRLLVDLPSEKDRESILKIHLKDEQLDSAVSMADLASKTPLYSGSDLKNLAVAAALTAVREENDAAAQHAASSPEPYVFPERRVLTAAHFDKAMEEITASVSNDMSSLTAIRKFDEQYGDRRGKKKRQSYGFAGGAGVKEDAAKVRS